MPLCERDRRPAGERQGDELALRLARTAVVLEDGDDPRSALVDQGLGETELAAAGRADRLQAAIWLEPMQAPVPVVDQDDRVTRSGEAGAAIFVQPRADIDR